MAHSPFLFFSTVIVALTLMCSSSSLFCQECRPPAFEKIYVGPYNIRTTPEGIYHITPSGALEKVRAIRSDYHGTYVIKFKQECPICGRYYDDNTIKDGYDCPLSKTEVVPHLWCK